MKMTIYDIRRELLASILATKFKGKQIALSEATGIAPSLISRYLNGTKNIGEDVRNKIEEALGLPSLTLDGISNHVTFYGEEVSIAQNPHSETPIALWESESDLEPGFVFVPRMTIRLAAGDGCEVIEESEKDKRQAFRAEWIRTLGLDAKKLVCMNAQGDSMIPEINDGDSLLVDRSQTQIIDGKIYAIRFGNSLKVKRLYKTLSGVLIQSANADKNKYRDEEITGSNLEHIEVLGRVVWKGGLM